jgi:signal transduction histidine kinase
MFRKGKVAVVFVLVLVCLARYSYGQNSAADVEWYESFFQKQEQKPIDEVLPFAKLKWEKAKEKKESTGEVNALIELGLIHLTRLNDYENALDFLIKSLTIEDSLGLKKEQIFTYLAMARVFEEVGNYPKSLEYLKEAKTLSDSFDGHLKALVLNESGRINEALDKVDDAFKDYEFLLEYAEELNQPAREADALFHLGRLHAKKRDYAKALDHQKKALAIRRSVKDKRGEAITLNDIGKLYGLMKNQERAFANFEAAIEICTELKDEQGLAESYNNIGVLNYQREDFQKAIDNLQLALQAAQTAQAQDQLRKSYEYLSLCYKNLKDFEKALTYKEQLTDISEFIQHEKDELQLLERQNRYVINKKETVIDQLQLDKAQRQKEIATQKKLRNFLFLLIGLGAMIVVLILYQYLAKRKSNKVLRAFNEKVNEQNTQLQNLNATKDKFFSIIGHDVKGPLNSLTSFSGLLINHWDSLSKEEIQMLAKDLDKSLKNLFALLENLLEWSRSQTGNIEFKAEEFDLAAVLKENEELLKTQAQNKKLSLVNNNGVEVKVNAHKHSVNTVIRNLLSNAIKFTPEGGTITLSAQKNENEIKVSISDTGVGMSEKVMQKLFRIDAKHSTIGTADEKGTGLGLILCKEFIEKNGGQIGAESEVGKGSVFYFTLPCSI